MSLFCLCAPSGDSNFRVAIGQAGPLEPAGYVIGARMKPVEIGMAQYIEHASGLSRHYPNVDVYECPKCGTRIVRE